MSKILVIDDEPAILKLMVRILKMEGYVVSRAASGEEGISLLKAQKFDLLVVDKNLPGVSGIEVIKHSRTKLPNAAYIVVTGFPSSDSEHDAFMLGTFDYIIKPFSDISVLTSAVKKALKRQQLLSETKSRADKLQS